MSQLRCRAAKPPGLEARRNRVSMNLPIARIARALGFDDPAYFSRLFCGATGLSPRGLRDKVHTGA